MKHAFWTSYPSVSLSAGNNQINKILMCAIKWVSPFGPQHKPLLSDTCFHFSCAFMPVFFPYLFFNFVLKNASPEVGKKSVQTIKHGSIRYWCLASSLGVSSQFRFKHGNRTRSTVNSHRKCVSMIENKDKSIETQLKRYWFLLLILPLLHPLLLLCPRLC